MMLKTLIRGLLTLAAVALLALLTLVVVYYEPQPGDDAPRVLVAVDRTMWNRVGLNRLTYVRTLRRAGLHTVLAEFPADGTLPAALFDDIEGLVLTGGGDVAASAYGGDPAVTLNVKPARDAFETALLARAEADGLPVLGLCRGAQLLNVHRGGTLGDFRDEPRFPVHRNLFRGHPVDLVPGSRLAAIYDTTRLDTVTTWHGQYVDTPGDGVVISAFSPDGIAEAIEVPGEAFTIGVQWHAEIPPWRAEQQPLFDAFAAAVRAAR